MGEPITMDLIMTLIGVIMAVEGLLKAIEWGVSKINAQHDKSKKIDENSETLDDFKNQTKLDIYELNNRINDAHKYATNALVNLETTITNALAEQKKEYMRHLTKDKEEYIEGIKRVENSIMEMQAVYQQTVAVVDIKIDNLEKAQNKHNNLIERMYKVEQQELLHDEQIRNANHRIENLEKK